MKRHVASLLLVTAIVFFDPEARGQRTTRVSVDSTGAEGNGLSVSSSASADGRVVAFEGAASNLVAGDSNAMWDVFVHDTSTGITERISVSSSGGEGNAGSGMPSISADGTVVAFWSGAWNLVAQDRNASDDIFVHDRSTGITERVSVDSSGVEGDASSWYPVISADGQVVAFWSDATNLVAGDTNNSQDVFVHDRSTGITERVSVDSSGAEANGPSRSPTISADGRFVAFSSSASNLVSGDTNGTRDVFVHDRSTGVTERVSVNSNGGQTHWGASDYPSMTPDGQIVAFESLASNLVFGDTNGYWDIFVHDRSTGITERISVDSSGSEADYSSFASSISADGRVVAFMSPATNLVSGDTNLFQDVFVRDRATGTTERASVDSSGGEANGNSFYPSLAADASIVAFDSEASNLVSDLNGAADVFVREICYVSASWSNYGAGFAGTNGIPTITAQQNPVLGSTVTADVSNSYGAPTAGLLFLGVARQGLHSVWGGDLLVVPTFTFLITFSYGGDSFTGAIPNDWSLCGVTVDLQAIEADPGATHGVSFTPGLELVLGR